MTPLAEAWIATALVLWAAGLGATGCGATSSAARTVPLPNVALAAWSRAIASQDADAAWALLDTSARTGLDEAQFRALLMENRGEIGAQAQIIGVRAEQPVTAQARLALVDGEVVVLVLEHGVWRIDGGVLDTSGLPTPQDAIASLRRALLRRSLTGVLRVLSRTTRGEVEAERARLLEATEDPADLDLHVEGDHAEVRLTGGAHVRLVREAGEWRVVDVE